MDTVMQIFAIIGIIVAILALIIFVAWAVVFYSTVAVKTFRFNLGEYVRVKNEHIQKKSEARRLRLEKSREQSLRHKDEKLAIKLQTQQDIHEIKKRELIEKEKLKLQKQKVSASSRSNLNFDDIGAHNYESYASSIANLPVEGASKKNAEPDASTLREEMREQKVIEVPETKMLGASVEDVDAEIPVQKPEHNSIYIDLDSDEDAEAQIQHNHDISNTLLDDILEEESKKTHKKKKSNSK